jgi:biotin carboxyl carrier protein
VPDRVRLSGDGSEWLAEVTGTTVSLSGTSDTCDVRDLGDRRFAAGGVEGVAAPDGDGVWVSIAGELFHFRVHAGRARVPAHADALSPPMSATVVRIAVKPGDRVQAGDTLVVLEAMKMELPIRASRDAEVRAVHCQEGELVQPGTVLVELA